MVLSQLRTEIDAIDRDLITLFKQRAQLVQQVGEYKASQKSHGQAAQNVSFVRSGREASMVRKLVNTAADTYPERFVIQVWRNVIATSLNMEHPMRIAAYFQDDMQEAYWLAREYFPTLEPEKSSSSDTLIKQIAAGTITIGVLPLSHINHWWQHLADVSQQVQIFAQIPFYSPSAFEPVFALAVTDPEPTEQDQTLLAITHKDSLANLSLPSYQLLRSDTAGEKTTSLIIIDGFYSKEALKEMLPETTHYRLGCIATPITLTKK